MVRAEPSLRELLRKTRTGEVPGFASASLLLERLNAAAARPENLELTGGRKSFAAKILEADKVFQSRIARRFGVVLSQYRKVMA